MTGVRPDKQVKSDPHLLRLADSLLANYKSQET
jgi:hypothetical protein